MQKSVLSILGRVLTLSAVLAFGIGGTGSIAYAGQTQTVATSADLRKALRQLDAVAGDHVIRLEPGVYDKVGIKGISGPMRLVAVDADNPPRLTGLRVNDSQNLSFENLIFDFTFDPETSKPWTSAFIFQNAAQLVFDHVLVDGDLMRGTGTDGDGYPAGKALVFDDTHAVTITNSEMRGFFVGLNIRRSSGITLQNSHMHGMRKDFIALLQVQDIAIIGNHFGGHNLSFDFDDHPDVIQMWTKGSDKPSERITIKGNVFNSGTSPYSQTIFTRNNVVERGEAGHEMFFRDLVIENNVIINAHLHGLVIGETDGLIVRNNTLIRNPASEKPGMSDGLASPRIRVAEASRNVVIENNAAYRIPKPAGRDWIVRNNVEIQRHKPTAAGYYAGLFADALTGDPRDLSSFYYRKTSPLHQRGIGAPMLDIQP